MAAERRTDRGDRRGRRACPTVCRFILFPHLREPAHSPDRVGADRPERGFGGGDAAGDGGDTRRPAFPSGSTGPRTRWIPPTPITRFMPTLDLTRDDMLDRRPEARPAPVPADTAYVALGARLAPDLIETQKTTLAGFRLLGR